ncbi:DUSAM domain-containing protein [Archangium violaceum]|uniref:DUSAM domain-containing protein n=1 Tax=Archangium violaceum TaxID=83451 RepID=UPI0036D8A386
MAEGADLDDVWVLCRGVLEKGAPLDLTNETCALLRRTAPTAAISEVETEEALKNPESAEALMGTILSRFRESKRRFLDSMFRMTSLRDAGDIEGARQQMCGVLAVEIVPQYRRMAEEPLSQRERGHPRGSGPWPGTSAQSREKSPCASTEGLPSSPQYFQSPAFSPWA